MPLGLFKFLLSFLLSQIWGIFWSFLKAPASVAVGSCWGDLVLSNRLARSSPKALCLGVRSSRVNQDQKITKKAACHGLTYHDLMPCSRASCLSPAYLFTKVVTWCCSQPLISYSKPEAVPVAGSSNCRGIPPNPCYWRGVWLLQELGLFSLVWWQKTVRVVNLHLYTQLRYASVDHSSPIWHTSLLSNCMWQSLQQCWHIAACL